MAIDVSTMTVAAMEAAKVDSYKKAQEIVDGARKAAGEGGDIYANMDGDTWNKLKSHMADVDLLETAATQAKAGGDMEARIKAAFGRPVTPSSVPYAGGTSDSGGRPQTLGEAFVKSDIYRTAFDRTSGFNDLQDQKAIEFSFNPEGVQYNPHARAGQKALVYTGTAVGGPFLTPYYDPEVERSARPTPDVLDLMSRVKVETDTISYILQTARSTQATAVAEATNSTGTTGTKPEATITYERRTGIVEIIAVTAAITEKELADGGQIRALIDVDLMDDLALQLDNQILNGTGTSPQLTGILNTSGIQTVGYSTAIGNILDNMLRAQIVIMTADEPAPDGYILNPLDWEPMRTAKSALSGDYFWGSPGTLLFNTLWGLPVVVSNRMTANTGLCGAFKRACKLYDREQMAVKVGYINDDFTRNILRLRAEMRACFVTRRPAAIARVTGI